MRSRVTGLLTLAVAALLVAYPATAADPTPEPMPCVGAQFTDPAGDLGSLSPGPEPPASMDLKRGFFRYVTAADGKKVLTANMQVANLSKEAYADAVGIEWELRWSALDNKWTAGVRLDPQGELHYFAGSTYIDDPQGPTVPASTGRFIEGADGVIEIVVPSPERFAGKTLTEVHAFTTPKYTPIDRDGQESAKLDRAPNGEAFGQNFSVAECPAATPTPTATSAGTDGGVIGEATPTPSGGVTGGTPTPPAQQASPFNPSVGPTSFKAKKVKKAKSIAFTVDARETLKNARFEFNKGSKLLSAVTKATFTKGKVTLRLNKRGLKKGTYSLVVFGTRANNAAAAMSFVISVK